MHLPATVSILRSAGSAREGADPAGGARFWDIEALSLSVPAAARATTLLHRVHGQVIPHHETFRTTIQSPYSSIKG